MSGIYISVSEIDDSFVWCDVESAVVFFIHKYLGYSNEVHPPLHLVIDEREHNSLRIDLVDFEYTILKKNDVDEAVKNCYLPVYYQQEKNYCFAGFCAVLRQIVKASDSNRCLLGFREACLSACAEFSIWTKFCEVDLVSSIKRYLQVPLKEIPVDVIRLEHHLGQPVRTHNIRKQYSRFPSADGLVQHSYVEGPEMYISDLIVVPLIHSFFYIYELQDIRPIAPLICKWYELMLSDNRVLGSLSIISFPTVSKISEFSVPTVKVESLYKCDPRRYKASDKIFTKQEDVEHVMDLIDTMGVLQEYDYLQKADEEFSWDKIPFHAHPKGGSLPEDRLGRKMQQIENIVMAVLRIAEEGDTIVDFCCGVGHIGILIAYLLPKCRILLLDNKEHSLQRAVKRIVNLGLQNVFVVQSNIDYFMGTFQIGVTLHACGVATDLVMKACIANRSKFVISPCCYGKLQVNHILQYPRSERFSTLKIRDYMIAAHGADQTHKEEYSKSHQGEKCMKIVDVDRCLHAEETGYRVYVAKMKPVTCSPKNNFIVGVPEEQFLEHYFP